MSGQDELAEFGVKLPLPIVCHTCWLFWPSFLATCLLPMVYLWVASIFLSTCLLSMVYLWVASMIFWPITIPHDLLATCGLPAGSIHILARIPHRQRYPMVTTLHSLS